MCAAEVTKCETDLFCGVNRPKDLDNMTDLERKHMPVISAPESVAKGECFEATVEVGKLLDHPNEPGHFIQCVELYAGDTFLARMDFSAMKTCPTMKACVALDHAHGSLRAYERCNLHGTWAAEVPIEVTG